MQVTALIGLPIVMHIMTFKLFAVLIKFVPKFILNVLTTFVLYVQILIIMIVQLVEMYMILLFYKNHYVIIRLQVNTLKSFLKSLLATS